MLLGFWEMVGYQPIAELACQAVTIRRRLVEVPDGHQAKPIPAGVTLSLSKCSRRARLRGSTFCIVGAFRWVFATRATLPQASLMSLTKIPNSHPQAPCHPTFGFDRLSRRLSYLNFISVVSSILARV
jgi:hypothetical protein